MISYQTIQIRIGRSVDGGEGLFRARLLLAAGCPVRVPEGSPADTGRVLRGQGARTQLPQRVIYQRIVVVGIYNRWKLIMKRLPGGHCKTVGCFL
ncbi:hypothetical protein AVEN_109647-1 [Araneus ventricosus]|uniref:Uncharacterized protein n=1 Tax=Araneus ventricosus TaxID=182803 RepID=A0A4Y2FY50_ARAVE|nr:hypothetical protein AVEN_109647-1 [Araneus ventricosus]